MGLYCASDPALTGLYGESRIANLGGAGRAPTVADVCEALGGMA